MNKREAILIVDDDLKSENSSKVMTLFSNKPFLEYVLDFYNLFGFNHFVMMVRDKKHSAVSYFGNKYKNSKLIWKVYNAEGGECDAITNGMKELESDNFLVASASVFFRANIGKFFKDHCDKRLSISALLHNKQEANNNLVVEVDITGRIKNIATKTYYSKKHLAFSGIYMINKMFMQSDVLLKSGSIEQDILKKYYKNEQIQVMISDNYYLNINELKENSKDITLNKFDIEYIVSDIEKNQSQLELVS